MRAVTQPMWNRAILGGGIVLLLVGHWGAWCPTLGTVLKPHRTLTLLSEPLLWVTGLGWGLAFCTAITCLLRPSLAADAWTSALAWFSGLLAILAVLGRVAILYLHDGRLWTWDPTLTMLVVLLFAYAGYSILRHMVSSPLQRANWSSVVLVLIVLDLPVIWWSVGAWNGASLGLNVGLFAAASPWWVWWSHFLGLCMVGAVCCRLRRLKEARALLWLECDPPDRAEVLP